MKKGQAEAKQLLQVLYPLLFIALVLFIVVTTVQKNEENPRYSDLDEGLNEFVDKHVFAEGVVVKEIVKGGENEQEGRV